MQTIAISVVVLANILVACGHPIFDSSAKSPKNVVCPGGTSQCRDGHTCCKLSSGQYGCCPQPNAVCCSDGLLCCPSGYTCNVSAGTCTKQGGTIALLEKISSEKSPEYVAYPDGQSYYKDSQTCRKLSSGQYGCCPLPDAVLCIDGVHCCPEGYTCNVSDGSCSKQGETIAFLEKILTQKSPDSVMCPDRRVKCLDGQTCCKLSGSWGCCPLPNAVCCSDGTSCCPEGYTCDKSSGTCDKSGERIAFLKKISAKKLSENVMRLDGQSNCQDGQTNCKLSSGQYGCCPQSNAVCCSDGLLCCPSGYTCNVSAGTCTKQGGTIALLEKISSEKSPEYVAYPDGQSYYKDSQTCRKLSSGQYGCCPLPDAVLCIDGVHCCPEGYTCNVSDGSCSKQGETIAFLEKILTQKSPDSVMCPDRRVKCLDGQTCCKLSGSWGCCPLPNAVCCSDGTSCCPEGYTCDKSSGTCDKSGERIAFLEKISAKKLPENVMRPDGQSNCQDGQTYCKLSSGRYGCCPQPNAVCCSDGVHCCPSGHTCNVSAGTCTKQGEIITFLKKVAANSPKKVFSFKASNQYR